MKQFKKLVVMFMALCLVATAVSAVYADDANTDSWEYRDVETGTYYYNSVGYCSRNNIMVGVAEGRFGPDMTMTRAMFVTVLYRIEGKPAVDGAGAFTDVAAGTWYTDAVNWAAKAGIVAGVTATTFAPDSSITREQMCAMMIRYANYKGYESMSGTWAGMSSAWFYVSSLLDSSLEGNVNAALDPYDKYQFMSEDTKPSEPFEDTMQISDWALDSVYTCYNAGIIYGVSETEFGPEEIATRAQVATVLHRFMRAMTTQTSEKTEGDVKTVTYSDQYGAYATDVSTFADGKIVSRVYSNDKGYKETENYTTDEKGNSVCAYANSDGMQYTRTVDPATGTTEYTDQYGTSYITEYDNTTGLPEKITYKADGVDGLCQFSRNGQDLIAINQITNYYSADGKISVSDNKVIEYTYINNKLSALYLDMKETDMSTGEVLNINMVNHFRYHDNGVLSQVTMDMSDNISDENVTYIVSVSRSVDCSQYEISMTLGDENMKLTVNKNSGITVTAQGQTVTATWDDVKNGALSGLVA